MKCTESDGQMSGQPSRGGGWRGAGGGFKTDQRGGLGRSTSHKAPENKS